MIISCDTSPFFHRLQDFFEDQSFSDIKVFVNGSIFPCHKVILAAAIPYFHSQFSNHAEVNETYLHGISSAVFKYILDFIYGKELTLSKEKVDEVYNAAETLQMTSLQDKCAEFYIENCEARYFDLYNDARWKDRTRLADKVLHKIALEFDKQVMTKEFGKISVETLLKLLKHDDLKAFSEGSVFDLVCSNWIRGDEERMSFLTNVLSSIRVRFCKDYLMQHKYILQSPEACRILQQYDMSKSEQARNFYAADYIFFVTYSLTIAYDIETQNVYKFPSLKEYGEFKVVSLNNKLFSIYANFNVEMFDLSFGSWKKIKHEERSKDYFYHHNVFAASCEKINGIYVCLVKEHEEPKIKIYFPAKNGWEDIPTLYAFVYDDDKFLDIIVLNGLLYVFSKHGIQRYDPTQKDWTNLKDSWQYYGQYCGLVVHDGKIFMCGGYDENNFEMSEKVQCYNPLTDTCEEHSHMNEERKSFTVLNIKGKLVAVGGTVLNLDYMPCCKHCNRMDYVDDDYRGDDFSDPIDNYIEDTWTQGISVEAYTFGQNSTKWQVLPRIFLAGDFSALKHRFHVASLCYSS